MEIHLKMSDRDEMDSNENWNGGVMPVIEYVSRHIVYQAVL